MAKAKTTSKAKGDGAAKPRRTRKKKAEPSSRGLPAPEVLSKEAPAEVEALAETIEKDGGAAIGRYRDPLGGHWQVLAALPIEKVKPTPFQRDLSDAHVERLGKAIDGIGRFLDPIVAVRTEAGEYWTPNGYHRTEAMRRLGARAITALVIPDRDAMFRILALNTEKAHNLRERALEVIRMARALADLDPGPESDYTITFEEPSLVTLGLCYEERGRFAGGAYQSLLKRIDQFLPDRLPKALEKRKERAALLFALDDAVAEAMAALKKRGFESPYLRNFVVARINPLRFQRGATAPFEATVERMIAAAKTFDASRVKADQLAQASGPPPE
jgi:ParB family chromosome partitioning protein